MKEKKAKRSSGGISWIFGYLGFGVGAIGMDLSYGLFNSFLTKYLTDVLLLNATFLLIVPTLARIWDGINDPMMGRMAMKKRGKDEKIISPSSLLMLIPTTIVTIGGYFIANGLMYDFGAAIAELPTCWLQPGVGALIYIVVGIGLDKINFKKKLSL